MNTDADTPNGRTTNEIARLLRVGQTKVLNWIKRGELIAVNTATRGRARYVVLPADLEKFLRGRRASTPAEQPPPRRRRRQPGLVDYYPGD
jgi:excisionase family DNA binding protein